MQNAESFSMIAEKLELEPKKLFCIIRDCLYCYPLVQLVFQDCTFMMTPALCCYILFDPPNHLI